VTIQTGRERSSSLELKQLPKSNFRLLHSFFKQINSGRSLTEICGTVMFLRVLFGTAAGIASGSQRYDDYQQQSGQLHRRPLFKNSSLSV